MKQADFSAFRPRASFVLVLAASVFEANATSEASPPPALASASSSAPAPSPPPTASVATVSSTPPSPTAPASTATSVAAPLTTTEAKTPPDTVAEARATYQMGNTLASWSLFTDALLEFQRSARLHPHAQTTYRMAECERGLGHDTRARELLAQALTMEPGLDEGSRADAKAILERLDKHLVTLQLDVSAEGAALQIDGAPPVPERSATASDKASSGLIAGIAPAGSGMLLSTSKVEVRMNAGHHRIVIAKEGFDAVIVERDFEAGSTVRLPIALRRSIQRYAGYSLIGLGSLGLVGALTSAIFTGVKLEESNSLCVETRCLPGGKEAYGQAHDASIAANWLLGTSALVLGGGVIFWATSGARADSPAPTIPSIHVSAGGSHNAAAFSISGSF